MSEAEEQVVLVDEQDRETGVAGKWAAHRTGQLHRAVSVLIHDGRGRHLLQKRQYQKYHSRGLWTNACCSHPRPGEAVAVAARRRLREEMGIDCPLEFLFTAIYRQDVGEGLIEHELVHVFMGRYSGPISPEPLEADGYQWLHFDELIAEIEARAHAYTAWFRIYLSTHASAIRSATS